MHPSSDKLPFSVRVLQSILTGIWMWNFFPPMSDLNLIVNPDTFIWFLAILALAQMVPLAIVRILAAVLASFGYVLYYFRPEDVPLPEGIRAVVQAELSQVATLFQGSLPADPLQTQLFLLILTILFWFVVYASARPKLWLFYNGLGILVLSIVDGNTNVHPVGSIVALICIAVIVLGILQYSTLLPTLLERRQQWKRFFAPLCILLLAGSSAAFLLPKQPAVWANPFVRLGQVMDTGGAVVHMIGYQLDDSTLGGSFEMNQTPVLSVIADRPSYIRGQTLTTYTGKGWKSADLTDALYSTVDVDGQMPEPRQYAFAHLPSQPLHQTIEILSNQLDTRFLLGNWAISKVASLPDIPSGSSFRMDMVQDNIEVPSFRKGQSYSINTVQLEDPYSTLAESTTPYSQAEKSFPPIVKQYYEQLPSGLPSRVQRLAEQITAGSTTEFQMVNAIQEYLQGNYTYATQGIPVPGENQDYVDQFLFSSKKGYCNNFSSAMAVMLRTLGIPTRWVTGFTDGQLDTSYKGSHSRYVIRESNAHSWVEVLFPRYGWVPFDPTPNFNLDFAPTPASTTPSSPNSHDSGRKPPVKVPPVLPDKQSGTSNATTSAFNWTGFFKIVAWAFAGFALLFGILAWVFRRQIREARQRRIWKGSQNQVLVRAMQYLIKQLRRYGIVPQTSLTLRDLHNAAEAHGVDAEDYIHLVQKVEAAWYGNEAMSRKDAERVKRTWLNWVTWIFRNLK